jgi:phosphoenolpyruvate synthase/pyruvate phosphate dikinase
LENLNIYDIIKKMNRIKSLLNLKEPKISEVGAKGYSLTIFANKNFDDPKSFVITSVASEAFFKFLKRRIENLILIYSKIIFKLLINDII